MEALRGKHFFFINGCFLWFVFTLNIFHLFSWMKKKSICLLHRELAKLDETLNELKRPNDNLWTLLQSFKGQKALKAGHVVICTFHNYIIILCCCMFHEVIMHFSFGISGSQIPSWTATAPWSVSLKHYRNTFNPECFFAVCSQRRVTLALLQEKLELYFSDPQKVLDLRTKLTEEILSLTQCTNREKETLVELQRTTETTAKKL